MLSVSEIFSSIQGEGKFTGYPTTFIRLYKCNLKCVYCDTKYASVKGKQRNAGIDAIVKILNELGNTHVCITGGEPLLQDEIYPLIYDLVSRNYIVSIETNGSIPIEKDEYNRSFVYCMDIKCPSSRMASFNCYENLRNLKAKDEVKFVISDYTDYLFAKGVLKQYPTFADVIFSPCFDEKGNTNASSLAEWIEQDKLPNVRLGVQIHKCIGFK
jgi:7-carboxy-7-deazaguanine synthase